MLLRRENRLARLREDFVSGVSHELRTPLTQIRLLSELLKSDGFRTDAERSRATDVIHREALRLSNLVDNVLEFSRSRRMPPQQNGDRVSIIGIVREVRESLAPLLEAQANKVDVIGDGVEASGGHEAVSRVIRNLIENAVKYGPPGQMIRVTITAPNGTAGARVTIDDEGPGIPTAERQRIWQPYYRLDRDRNAAAGGSGIGLAVVADLMRQLGGTAWVGDAPTKGARFTLEFPVRANGR
jgi:signal transduction histidine kinase